MLPAEVVPQASAALHQVVAPSVDHQKGVIEQQLLQVFIWLIAAVVLFELFGHILLYHLKSTKPVFTAATSAHSISFSVIELQGRSKSRQKGLGTNQTESQIFLLILLQMLWAQVRTRSGAIRDPIPKIFYCLPAIFDTTIPIARSGCSPPQISLKGPLHWSFWMDSGSAYISSCWFYFPSPLLFTCWLLVSHPSWVF